MWLRLTLGHGRVYGLGMDNTWTIKYMDGDTRTSEQVIAEGWQIGPSGDLVFLNDPYSQKPFYTRAFAKGVWLEVSLYA